MSAETVQASFRRLRDRQAQDKAIRADVIAMIAQAVINIDCGLTTIEKDSPIYRAMVAIVKAETK